MAQSVAVYLARPYNVVTRAIPGVPGFKLREITELVSRHVEYG